MQCQIALFTAHRGDQVVAITMAACKPWMIILTGFNVDLLSVAYAFEQYLVKKIFT